MEEKLLLNMFPLKIFEGLLRRHYPKRSFIQADDNIAATKLERKILIRPFSYALLGISLSFLND